MGLGYIITMYLYLCFMVLGKKKQKKTTNPKSKKTLNYLYLHKILALSFITFNNKISLTF